LISSTIVVLDSAIVKFSSFSGTSFSTLVNVAIFVIFYTLFVATGILLINSVRKSVSRYEYKLVPPFDPRYFYYMISITFIFTLVLILLIILQVTLLNEYSLSLLRVQTYVSHISALVFLSFLIFLFVRWLKFRRNYIVILYSIIVFTLSFSYYLSDISRFLLRRSHVIYCEASSNQFLCK
jgi:hypothetical protein